MIKRKSTIIVVTALFLLVFINLLISRNNLSNENNLLKKNQGEAIQENIIWLEITISYAQEDLANNNCSTSNLYRDYWKFNESTLFDLPKIGLAGYIINIRNDFGELIKLRESKASQQEIDVVKNNLESKISKLKSALILINKECGNDNMKYYLLNFDDNETVENALKILNE